MIKNRNVSIITDENNNQIVIINDKKFKGLSKDDWQQIEKYLKGYMQIPAHLTTHSAKS